jgi:hypothetical protein
MIHSLKMVMLIGDGGLETFNAHVGGQIVLTKRQGSATLISKIRDKVWHMCGPRKA